MRYDIVRLNSGSKIRSLRQRLHSIGSEDPVVLVRRQGVSQVSWHRVSIRQLMDVLQSAPDDDALSAHVVLDPVNEVPVIAFESVRGDDTAYGAVLRDGEVIAFSEGMAESALEGPSRGDVAEPPVRPPPPQPSVVWSGRPEAAEEEGQDAAESTFRAYPTIEAPTTVKPEVEFEVSVGVAPEPVRHTASPGLEAADLSEAETVILGVLVSGPFTIAEGSDNAGEIEVDRASFDHDPLRVRLIPGPPPDTYDPQVGVWTAEVVASFFHEGVFIGEGRRELRVNEMGARSLTIESDAAPVETHGPELGNVDDSIDLVIAITRVEPGAIGRFNVRLFSKYLSGPIDAGIIDLGTDPSRFAAQLIREIGYTIANRVSDETLNAIAGAIADPMPEEVETTLRRVWEKVNPPNSAKTGRSLDVLLLTDDWAVPWELMSIDIDPTRPGFLGAQVNLGRWPASKFELLRSEPVGVRGLGVMVGHYQDARGVVPLPRAEEEGRDLRTAYLARVVNADAEAFDQLLTGRLEDGFEFEGLHFAGHGESDPERGTYLMYSNGARMGVFAWGSARVATERAAFLFVNACQVGTAEETLNAYGGLAGQAVNAGFRGFVAPLWSVSDDIARSISLGLYQASVEGSTISGYLREVRSNFRETDDQPAHTTYLAYVFYGHPGLRLGGPEARSD